MDMKTCEDEHSWITGCWEELRKKQTWYCSRCSDPTAGTPRANFCMHIFTTKSRGVKKKK